MAGVILLLCVINFLFYQRKKLLKSVHIYGSYRKIKTGVPFFLEHPVLFFIPSDKRSNAIRLICLSGSNTNHHHHHHHHHIRLFTEMTERICQSPRLSHASSSNSTLNLNWRVHCPIVQPTAAPSGACVTNSRLSRGDWQSKVHYASRSVVPFQSNPINPIQSLL